MNKKVSKTSKVSLNDKGVNKKNMANKNKNILINCKVDKTVKECAEATLSNLGLNMSSYITMCLRQVSQEGKIPFNPESDPEFWEIEDEVSRLNEAIKSGIINILADSLKEYEKEQYDDIFDYINYIYNGECEHPDDNNVYFYSALMQKIELPFDALVDIQKKAKYYDLTLPAIQLDKPNHVGGDARYNPEWFWFKNIARLGVQLIAKDKSNYMGLNGFELDYEFCDIPAQSHFIALAHAQGLLDLSYRVFGQNKRAFLNRCFSSVSDTDKQSLNYLIKFYASRVDEEDKQRRIKAEAEYADKVLSKTGDLDHLNEEKLEDAIKLDPGVL